jgi:5,10-methenyltetrahydromethanopterin hydrogenase
MYKLKERKKKKEEMKSYHKCLLPETKLELMLQKELLIQRRTINKIYEILMISVG